MRTLDLPTLVRIFGNDETQLTSWIDEFRQFLSPLTNTVNAEDRQFTENDLSVLIYVHDQSECGESNDDIHSGLNCGEHESDSIRELACLHTPIFQDVPEQADETWQHGALIGGMASRQWVEVARSYKVAADSLVTTALKTEESHTFAYPIFFLYRHCLELYLKTILDGTARGHFFDKLIAALEEKYGKSLGGWIRERLEDFHEIDRKSDMFRYPEDVPDGELWINFHQLRFVMDRMVKAFEDHIQQERAAKKS
jgi:hypothetical protein